MRIGQGFDAHQLVPDRRLVLGGVDIPYDRGLEGHSDGDVVYHAVCDAILGAMADGDLGKHFPSSDESLRGVDSAVLLGRVVERMTGRGLHLGNLDLTVIAQAPRLATHQAKMESNLVTLLHATPDRVNLKLTTTDHLGALGRQEGIAALAVVLLEASQEGTQARE
ncbi:MAG: 2-C-methyl-D-erythritol 2,4-cyclodiphosphate synthase [Myxococcota bacterium]|nr:2-C-methyl-D-erythritol 2,4-cyclodiphosphate synthase [Myxococcota bacterium]